jgi:hypothetical protein
MEQVKMSRSSLDRVILFMEVLETMELIMHEGHREENM